MYTSLALVQVGGELKPSHERRLHYLRLAVTDLETENLIANFERAFAFIDQARSKGAAGRPPVQHALRE